MLYIRTIALVWTALALFSCRDEPPPKVAASLPTINSQDMYAVIAKATPQQLAGAAAAVKARTLVSMIQAIQIPSTAQTYSVDGKTVIYTREKALQTIATLTALSQRFHTYGELMQAAGINPASALSLPPPWTLSRATLASLDLTVLVSPRSHDGQGNVTNCAQYHAAVGYGTAWQLSNYIESQLNARGRTSLPADIHATNAQWSETFPRLGPIGMTVDDYLNDPDCWMITNTAQEGTGDSQEPGSGETCPASDSDQESTNAGLGGGWMTRAHAQMIEGLCGVPN